MKFLFLYLDGNLIAFNTDEIVWITESPIKEFGEVKYYNVKLQLKDGREMSELTSGDSIYRLLVQEESES